MREWGHNKMKEHAGILGSLAALLIIIGAGLVLIIHGAKDETLLAIIFTGAVTIAQTIAGIKPAAPPGTTSITQTSTPAEPKETPQ